MPYASEPYFQNVLILPWAFAFAHHPCVSLVFLCTSQCLRSFGPSTTLSYLIHTSTACTKALLPTLGFIVPGAMTASEPPLFLPTVLHAVLT